MPGWRRIRARRATSARRSPSTPPRRCSRRSRRTSRPSRRWWCRSCRRCRRGPASGRIGAGAVARHVAQHAVGDEGVALVEHAVFVLANLRLLRLGQDHAARVLDLADQVGLHLVAAVGEHRVGAGHLQRRDRAGAERHGQVLRMARRVEAELAQVVMDIRYRHRAQQAHRRHVLRLRQRAAHRDRAVEHAVVVLRRPGLAGVFARHVERRIQDQRGRRKALFQRRRIQERLDRRSRLAPGLRHVIELLQVVVEAADQRVVRAGIGVDRHEGGRHLRQLDDGPVLLPSWLRRTMAPGASLMRAPGVRRQAGGGEFQAGAADLDAFRRRRSAPAPSSATPPAPPPAAARRSSGASAAPRRLRRRALPDRTAGRSTPPARGSRGAGRTPAHCGAATGRPRPGRPSGSSWSPRCPWCRRLP